MATNLLLAVGARGLDLSFPDNIELLPVERPVETGEPLTGAQQTAIVQAALDASALQAIAKGKRRAAILVGDLSLPAPYSIALPPLVNALVAADIRPSRVAFLAFPGRSGPLLGSGAIRRYGEEIAGTHELRNWQGAADPLFAAADLRIALATCFDALPAEVSADLFLTLSLGRKAPLEIVACSVQTSASKSKIPSVIALPSADVFICGGGGSAWDETLEEALLSLAACQAPTPTAVLAFSGEEGFGTAAFTNDVWALLDQAEQALAAGGKLNAPDATAQPFDPAGTFASALSRYERVVLLSSHEHTEFDDLDEKLNALPVLAKRLFLRRSPAQLWPLLAGFHGERYRVVAEPLGWRATLAL